MSDYEIIEKVKEIVTELFDNYETMIEEMSVNFIDDEIVVDLTLAPELTFFNAEEELYESGYTDYIKVFKTLNSQERIDEAVSEAKNMNKSSTSYFKNVKVTQLLDSNLESFYKLLANALSMSVDEVKKKVTLNVVVEEDFFEFYYMEDFFIYIDEDIVIDTVKSAIQDSAFDAVKVRDYFNNGILCFEVSVEGYSEAEIIDYFEALQEDIKYELARLDPPIYDYELDEFIEFKIN